MPINCLVFFNDYIVKRNLKALASDWRSLTGKSRLEESMSYRSAKKNLQLRSESLPKCDLSI